jgi:hypothetical protein
MHLFGQEGSTWNQNTGYLGAIDPAMPIQDQIECSGGKGQGPYTV